MARQSVPLDLENFCKLLLPDPTDPRFARANRLNVGKNPFAALRAAKSMSEKDISVALVSLLSCPVASQLTIDIAESHQR